MSLRCAGNSNLSTELLAFWTPSMDVLVLRTGCRLRQEEETVTFKISASLASKLASVVVHADELFSADGRIGFDTEALKQSARDPEVQDWIKSLGALAPVKRRG